MRPYTSAIHPTSCTAFAHITTLSPTFRWDSAPRPKPEWVGGEWSTLYFMFAFNCRLFIRLLRAPNEKKVRTSPGIMRNRTLHRDKPAPTHTLNRSKKKTANSEKSNCPVRNEDIIAVIFSAARTELSAIKHNEGAVRRTVPQSAGERPELRVHSLYDCNN